MVRATFYRSITVKTIGWKLSFVRRRYIDGNIAEHVRPILRFRESGGEDDVQSRNQGDEQSDDPGHLKDIIDRCKRPVILCSKQEMDA